MPIFEEEGRVTREELDQLRRKNKCAVCGERLDCFLDRDSGKIFLACHNWPTDPPTSHHEGIEREYQPSAFETDNPDSEQHLRRSVAMERQLGTDKAKALMKYEGVLSLTKVEAKEILLAIYGDAPEAEITRAVLLCASFQLNPLMKHVFLIPFNKGKPNESWATVIGIKAKRLMASRRGSFSYVGDTPRVMTDEEKKTTFGTIDTDRIWVVTKLKDPKTGAEVVGYGFWLNKDTCYGTDKGNTPFNMASIRSESQALDRLRPGEMPVGVEVVPEEAVEAEWKEVLGKEGEEILTPKPEPEPETTGVLKVVEPEHFCKEHNVPFIKAGKMKWWAHKIEGTDQWCNESRQKLLEESANQEETAPADAGIDMEWLKEKLKELKWTAIVSYLKNIYQVTGETVTECLEQMTPEQRNDFVKEVQERLDLQ